MFFEVRSRRLRALAVGGHVGCGLISGYRRGDEEEDGPKGSWRFREVCKCVGGWRSQELG